MNIAVRDYVTLQACALGLPQRREMIAHRRARSMSLGPAMRLQFEDELTARHQIREVLHAECITDPVAIQHEIDTYAHLLPDGTQWKATLLIQLPDSAERARKLALLSDAARDIYVECGKQGRVYALANDDLSDRHLARPSGVHFLRFQLPEAMRLCLLDGASAAIGCRHQRYQWHRLIPSATLRWLRGDLTRATCLPLRDKPGRAAPCRTRPETKGFPA